MLVLQGKLCGFSHRLSAFEINEVGKKKEKSFPSFEVHSTLPSSIVSPTQLPLTTPPSGLVDRKEP